MNKPLSSQPGYREESGQTNHLAKDLGQLARKHHLRGCVLVSFTDDRVGINSSGEPDAMADAMEQLADRFLTGIMDGKFDDIPKSLNRRTQ
jgi:hypothetical protein